MQARGHDWAISTLLVATIFLTWSVSKAALTGPFLFDDFQNFEHLKQISGCFDSDRVAKYLAAFIGSPGRPLSSLSFLIDDYAWPSTPYSWKRNNLLLHILCGVFVFGLVRTLARVRHTQSTADWIGIGVCAAWMLHPMQLSTSMLTVQRMTQLMTLISLAACWFTAYRLAAPPSDWRGFAKLLVLNTAMTVIAFLFKENGALLPLYLATTSVWMLKGHKTSSTTTRLYLAALLLPIVAIIAYLLFSAFRYQPDGIRDFTPWERLLTESRIVWDYLRQILLPRLDGSGIFHDDIAVSRSVLSPMTTLLSILTTLCLFALTIYKHRVWPLLAFAVVWFFGGHLMESTVWPLELYFEHRNYLPMVGVFAAIGIAIPSISSLKLRYAILAATLFWVMTCVFMTAVTAPIWGSQRALAEVWTREHPDSNRSYEILAKDQFENGDRVGARSTLMHGISKGPKFGGLAAHVLLVDCQTGHLTPEQMSWAARKLHEAPFARSSLEAVSMLNDLIADGTCDTPGAATGIRKIMQQLIADPDYQNVQVQAYLHVELARDAIRQGRFDDTIRNFQAAYKVMPNSSTAYALSATFTSGGYNIEALLWRRRAEQIGEEWPISWIYWWNHRIGRGVPMHQTCDSPKT